MSRKNNWNNAKKTGAGTLTRRDSLLLKIQNRKKKIVATKGQLKLPKFEIRIYDGKTLLNGQVFMIRWKKL